jgi:hypothetical protein
MVGVQGIDRMWRGLRVALSERFCAEARTISLSKMATITPMRSKSAATFFSKLGLLLVIVSAGYSPEAYGEVQIDVSGFSGTVSQVDENGLMHLSGVMSNPDAIPYRDSYLIREWRLEISPEALAVLTEGRRVACQYIYQTPEHIVASCLIQFEGAENDGGIRLERSLGKLAIDLGLGSLKCSESDKQAILTAGPNYAFPCPK